MTAYLLSLPVWLLLIAVGLLPLLESSAFVGFAFPGETVLVIGGVVAATGHLSLTAVMVVGVVGAVLGDAIGFTIGQRWGRKLFTGGLGRVVKPDHLAKAEAALSRMGGRAVFVGRFTVALRVLVPGLAGMSGMSRRTFTAWNVAGALLWAPGAVLIGYLGGTAWQHLARVATELATGVVAVVVAGWLSWWLLRRRRERRRSEAEAETPAETEAEAEAGTGAGTEAE